MKTQETAINAESKTSWKCLKNIRSRVQKIMMPQINLTLLMYVKAKLSRYRLGQALGVPGG